MYFQFGPTRVVRHTYSHAGTVHRVLLSIFLSIILVGLLWFSYRMEHDHMKMTGAFQEAKRIVVHAGDGSVIDHNLDGHLIHIASQIPIEPHEQLSDHNFGLNFPGAIRLQRSAEYCQWVEHSRTETKRNSRDEEETYTYYTYTKQWVSRPINSLFFHEPASHFNPLRDPYPSFELNAQSAKLGALTLSQSVIQKMDMWNKVNWPLNDPPLSVGPAFSDNNFKYVGNGYFYSSYQRGAFESVFHVLGQLAEGSMLEVQLGKLFGACEAGDIRLNYRVVSPREYSIMAKQNSDGVLVPYVASNGYKIGFGHKGLVPPNKMMNDELFWHKWTNLLLSRIGVIVWSLIVANFVLGDLPERTNLVYGYATLCIASFVIGTMWSVLWGVNMASVLLLIISTAVAVKFLTVKQLKRKD